MTVQSRTPSICSSLREKVSEAEWQARLELAAFYRVVDRYGMSQMTNNHITLKVPGTDDQFLINAYGLGYDEITASSLVKIDGEGKIVLQPDHGLGINYTGYVIHGAVHQARPDIHCVAHTHTRSGVAVSMLECGLTMSNNSVLFLVDTVAYHDYEGPALNLAERARLIRNLGANSTMILRHHGLLACGRDVAECFLFLYYLEMSCRTQIDAMSTGQPVLSMAPEAVQTMREAMVAYRKSGVVGRREWAAEMRRLDRTDPSYRE